MREVAKFEPSEPLTIDLRLTLHGGKSQLNQLKEWLEDNFISFETLEAKRLEILEAKKAETEREIERLTK